jgi:hypothetical protein
MSNQSARVVFSRFLSRRDLQFLQVSPISGHPEGQLDDWVWAKTIMRLVRTLLKTARSKK